MMRWVGIVGLQNIVAATLFMATFTPAVSAENPTVSSNIRWAYPVLKEKTPYPKLEPTVEYTVKGSIRVLTGDQLNLMDDPVDWTPSEHPVPPKIVAHDDRDRKLEACGACHGMKGQGGIDVPDIGGLPANYIAEQLHEFAKGRRRSSDPDRDVSGRMAAFASKLSESEIRDAARYFSSVTRSPLPVRVIEAERVPATRANHDWLELVPGGVSEPIGRRVIEVAEDFNQMWIGDPNSGIEAYVPTGAIARGKALVHHGANPCITCHGPTLRGVGKVPPLAGRAPYSLARAIWDIKSGARNGAAVSLMKKPASELTADQIVDVVAYLASLTP